MKALEDLVARGALLWAYGTSYGVGAVLLRGDRLVWAQQGADHQGHVHLLEGIKFRVVSPDMIDWVRADGSLFGTLEAMDSEEAVEHNLPEWRRFMADPENAARWKEFFASVAGDLLG